MRLLKTSGVKLPRSAYDSAAFFKTREFQILCKERALKLLVVKLQKAQNLPISRS